MLVAEVKLTAILKHPSGNVATFEGGPKREGFFCRAGDRLRDGHVLTIDFENNQVVLRQELSDPRLLRPYRDFVLKVFPD